MSLDGFHLGFNPKGIFRAAEGHFDSAPLFGHLRLWRSFFGFLPPEGRGGAQPTPGTQKQ